MKKLAAFVAGLIFLFSWVEPGRAQDRTPAELDQMLGPIALYPDPLISEILSGATFPSQIVEADRYIAGGGDQDQVEQLGWDSSVQALAHYPNVLKWLDDNIAWTTQLGQAFTTQQADVMSSIQRLRAQAQSLGNLPNTAQETVSTDDGAIEIEPTTPDDIYVPDYDPGTIFYQPGIYCAFGIGLPIGFWLVHDWDWHSHRLITWGRDHPRPGNWWHFTPGQRHTFIAGNRIPAWHPGHVGVAASHPAWERGYAPEEVARSPVTIVPRSAAPRVGEVPSARDRIGEARGVTAPAYRAPPAAAPRNFAPAEPAERAGSFGGFQSAPAARESSARGEQSRAAMGSGGRGGGGGKR
jgi:hypothetical protein